MSTKTREQTKKRGEKHAGKRGGNSKEKDTKGNSQDAVEGRSQADPHTECGRQSVHTGGIRMLCERFQQDETNWMTGIFEHLQRRFQQSIKIKLVIST